MIKTALTCTLLTLAACGDDTSGGDAAFKAKVIDGMHTSIAVDLQAITDAAIELQAAAPMHAWTAADAAAVSAMKIAWKKARVAYEHVEGATAPVFADLDFTMDARYDDYLAELGTIGDQNLFDGTGVIGMHALERILFAPDIRPEVIAFEIQLPGYKAAAWPTTDGEAMAFKTVLVQKLIDDATSLHDQWQPAAIDVGAAFVGLIGLMNEQKEKVNLAATGEEESRYANITLFDLRNNLVGTKTAYGLFRPWAQSYDSAVEADAMIVTKFGELEASYDATTGDGIPPVPADWSSDAPTATNLATPFGLLWQKVHQEVDPTLDGSIVFEMNEIAAALGFDEFVEE